MVIIQETGTILAKKVKIAQTKLERLKGLLGTDESIDYGYIIPNCNAVHTYYMQYPIDIIFYEEETGKILEIFPNVLAGDICSCKRAKTKVSVFECKAGGVLECMKGKRMNINEK